MKPGECPSDDLLQNFHEGTLSDHQAETVGDHLETCSSCRDHGAQFFEVPVPVEAVPIYYAQEAGYQQAARKIRQVISEPARTPSASEFSFPTQIGNYELLSELGAGGMGVVYLARQTRLDRLVAVKVLTAQHNNSNEHLLRFQREIKAAGKLDHPNIVRALDADTWEDIHFLVIEYVPGIDLSRLVRQVGQLSISDACELIRQAALGLSHAHARGLIHRDVKPSNMMLMKTEDEEFRVKVLDLGLAQLSHQFSDEESLKELTNVGQMMGTLAYMAPEQGEDSRSVSAQADIYSLGCTLYQLLCGETPFPGSRYNTPIKLMKALATESPPSIAEKRSIPQELARLIDSMLARDPADRPATCEAVAERLIPFAEECDLSKFKDQIETCGSPGTTPAGRICQSELLETLIHQNVSTDRDLAHPQQRSTHRSFLLLSLAAILLAGIILFLPAKNGFIRIEILDPSIQVTVDGEQRYLVTGKETNFEILPGKHSLHIKSDKLNFKTQQFDVTRGETILLKVSMVQGNTLRVFDGQKLLEEYSLPAPEKTATAERKTPPSGMLPKTVQESAESLAISKLNRILANKLMEEGKRILHVQIAGETKSLRGMSLPTGNPVRVTYIQTRPESPMTEEEFQLLINSQLVDLKVIRFTGQQIPAEWLEMLNQVYPDLQEVYGFENRSVYFDPISRFKKLTFHTIQGTTSEGNARWTQMLCEKPELTYIHYHMSRVDQNVLDILSQSKKIEMLGFMKESFGDKGLAKISQIKTLKTLRFDAFGGTFTREGLMCLAGHPNLKEIIVKAKSPAPINDILDLLKTLPGSALQIDIPGMHERLEYQDIINLTDPD